MCSFMIGGEVSNSLLLSTVKLHPSLPIMLRIGLNEVRVRLEGSRLLIRIARRAS